MLLALDVGNSTTVAGLHDGERFVDRWRLTTLVGRSSDELGLLLTSALASAGHDLARDVDAIVVGSVVPPVTGSVLAALERHASVAPLVVAPGVRTGIAIRHEHPQDLGADRIANAVALEALVGGPAIAVDLGTATSLEVLDASGAFVGGAIAPGIETSRAALAAAAARLPDVELVRPERAIGGSTVAALRSGLVLGAAGMVDGLVERLAEELGGEPTVVATGGLAPLVVGVCRTVMRHEPWLTLDGLRLIAERNR
jgi:type III pantothenate kinase